MTAGEDALREAARLEAARVYGRPCPEHKQAHAVIEPGLFERPVDSYYGPAAEPVLAQLVTALAPEAPRSSASSRRRIEQAIARGLDDDHAAAATGADLADVTSVRAAMDRLSA